MPPYVTGGLIPPTSYSYQDFQKFPNEVREAALVWLKGRTNHTDIVMDLITMNRAANDNPNGASEIGQLVSYDEFVMMLYCWVNHNRNEVKAKLAYVEGGKYCLDPQT